MTVFYICRHGETENNKNGRFSGWIDTPLTATGEQDALVVASKLTNTKISRIISSDLGRAFTTAYIIARQLGFEQEIKRTKNFREVNYGDFANKPYDTYPHLTPRENTNYIPPNGESLTQMQQRVLGYLSDLNVDSTDGTTLITAHDGTINAISASFLGEEMGVADLTHNSHSFVAKFEVNNKKVASFEEV